MQVEIEKLVFGGEGIGRLADSRPIFVSKTVPGDIIDVEILEDRKSFCRGVVEKIIKSSTDRINPPCPYFARCGGCDHQNISYENQLNYKQEIFQEVLDRAKIKTKPEKIIASSGGPFYYRNSIRFMFSVDSNNKIQFARHAFPNQDELVVVDRCMLQSEVSNQILKVLADFINTNVEYKKSFWQLKIREGKQTGDIMVEVITSDDDLPEEKGIIEELKQIEGVKSVYHTIAPGKSLLNLRRRLIFGSPVIQEKIGGFTFQISPESFFQPNSLGAKTLYDTIKKYAGVKFGDEVLDLFCGTGSIGIYLSTLAKKVTGIETVPEAIKDAKDNARINKIKNCEFISADVSLWLKQNKKRQFDKIILDPPRAGLKKELIFEICNLKFDILVYVSCNPSTFARDLKLFEDGGVLAKKIQPIDMFPQIHHIELVVLLNRKGVQLNKSN